MTIRQSHCLDGGSGGVGCFNGPRTADEGSPHKKCTQSFMGSAVLGRRVLRVQGVRGLQVHAAPAVTQQVILFKTKVHLGFPLVPLFARADLATAVYLIKVKIAENRPW